MEEDVLVGCVMKKIAILKQLKNAEILRDNLDELDTNFPDTYDS